MSGFDNFPSQPEPGMQPLTARSTFSRDLEKQPLLNCERTASPERSAFPGRSAPSAARGSSQKEEAAPAPSVYLDDDNLPVDNVEATGGATIFGHASGEKMLDIVQFSNMFFYVVEGQGNATLTAMRIGSLQTMCSVEFETEDNSAKAGLKYKRTRGRIEFLPNQELKTIEIKILEDDSFDTNLDFTVKLTDPIGCQLGDTLKTCRVVVIDDDVFPTNVYREEITKGDESVLDGIGVSLLIAFINFAILRIPLVGFRTGLQLFFDQLYNVNYLWSIWLNVYLVDVVFAIHRPESLDELWIPNQRLGTACLVALGIVLPKALLSFIESLKQGQLAVGGKVMLHLKVNLFRKYLYFNQQSHAKVSSQELTKAMEGDINELVDKGFVVIFQLAQQAVKVCVILYFLVRKRPSSALPLVIYPIAMAIVLNMRYETTLRLKDHCREAEKATMTCLRESCDDINLIKEYNMRSNVVSRYEKSITDQRKPGDAFESYDFRTMLVMPWITTIAIAAYVIVGGHFVLTSQLSLGAYLATINIYRDAGDLFAGFYGHLKDFYSVIAPLLRIIRLLNLEGDVQDSMTQSKERTAGMLTELQKDANMRKQFALAPQKNSRFDMLHIKMVHASLSNDRGGPTTPSLQDLMIEVEQGKMVSILGAHGTGKFSCLKLLTGLVKPKNGAVQVPTHLRCICVPNVPELFKNGNLLENLTFGTQGQFDKARLVKICGAVGLGDHTMSCLEVDMKEMAEVEAIKANGGTVPAKQAKEVVGIPWYEQLSQSEKLKMHITRALVLNPEVLLLHRPVDEMEADHAARILNVLRRHVDQRGLFTTPTQRAAARPHTVFFTTGEDRERAESAADVSDIVWHLSEKGFTSTAGGRQSAAEAFADEGKDCGSAEGGDKGNRIMNSWSRHVKSLETDLAKAKKEQTGLSDKHESEVDELRKENTEVKSALEDLTAQARRALQDARQYESELASWEGKPSGMCTTRGQNVPLPNASFSRGLQEMIAVGEGRSRSTSPAFDPNVDPREYQGQRRH